MVLCPWRNFEQLLFFDVATRRVSRNASAGPTSNLAIEPAGHRVYLARIDLDGVAVLDLDRWDYLDPITTTGNDGSYELKFVRAGEQFIQVAPVRRVEQDAVEPIEPLPDERVPRQQVFRHPRREVPHPGPQ